MITLKKYTGIIFLWTAGLFIIAHNVLPHHHHYGDEKIHNACEHSCNHDDGKQNIYSNVIPDFQHETENTEECDECHFNPEIIPNFFKVSINFSSTDLNHFSYRLYSYSLRVEFKNYNWYYNPIYSPQKTSRGPPIV